jgi:hypothetical protein
MRTGIVMYYTHFPRAKRHLMYIEKSMHHGGNPFVNFDIEWSDFEKIAGHRELKQLSGFSGRRRPRNSWVVSVRYIRREVPLCIHALSWGLFTGPRIHWLMVETACCA